MATKLAEGHETHGIAEIDGYFVPFTDRVDAVGPRGGLATVTIYWGYGYASLVLAKQAMKRTEAGFDTPPGQCRVSMNTGEVIR